MFPVAGFLLSLSGLTEDVSGLGLCGQEGVTDAVHVLSHDPDDVLTTFDQLRHLKQQNRRSRI